MVELERTIDVYKTINKQLSLENNRLKEDLKEKRKQILNLNDELQTVHASFAHFKQSVADVVANAAADFESVQGLISRNAGNFSRLIGTMMDTQARQSSIRSASEGSAATPRGTSVNKVKPMIRHPYGGFVQNISIRIPRLNESEIRSEVAQEQVELENTATSLYSEEEIEDDVTQTQNENTLQHFQPLRTAELLQERLHALEPQPSTSYEPEPEPNLSYDGLRPILEETENYSSEGEPPCTPPRLPAIRARRLSPSNKENSSPFSMSGAVASTPIPRNPQCAQIVLPRITNFAEFSEQNNVRISNVPPTVMINVDETTGDSSASESSTVATTRKRKKSVTVMKRRSTERPKRTKRPAKGALAEPSGRKKMRRSK